MTFKPLQGGASVSANAPVLPPARAEWKVNAKAKNSTATIFDGTATIYRSDKDGKFRCAYEKPYTVPAAGDQKGGTGAISLSIPLHDCPNLIVAQQRAEMMIRENLGKTHPEVLAEATQMEQVETVASAPKDPF